MMPEVLGPNPDEEVDVDVLEDAIAALEEPEPTPATPATPAAEEPETVPDSTDPDEQEDPVTPVSTPTPTPAPSPTPSPTPTTPQPAPLGQTQTQNWAKKLGRRIGSMNWFGKDIATRRQEQQERIENSNSFWEKLGNKVGLGRLIERVKEGGFFNRKEKASQDNIDRLKQAVEVQLAAVAAEPGKLDQWLAALNDGDLEAEPDFNEKVLVLYLKGKINHRDHAHVFKIVVESLLAGDIYGDTYEKKKKVVDALKMQLRGSRARGAGETVGKNWKKFKEAITPSKRKERRERLEAASAAVKSFLEAHPLQPDALKTALEARGTDGEDAAQISELAKLLTQYEESDGKVKDAVLGRILQLLMELSLAPDGSAAVDRTTRPNPDGEGEVEVPGTYPSELIAQAALLAEQGGSFWEKLRKVGNPFKKIWEGKVAYYGNLKSELEANMDLEDGEPNEASLNTWLEDFQKGDTGLVMNTTNRRAFAEKVFANDSIAHLNTMLDTLEGNQAQKKLVKQLKAELALLTQNKDRIQGDFAAADTENRGLLRTDARNIDAIYMKLAELKIEISADGEVIQNLDASGITLEEKRNADHVVALLLNDKIGSSKMLMKQKNLLKRAGYDLQAIIDLKKHLWKAKQKEKGGVMGWLAVANINVFEALQRVSPLSVSIDKYGRYNATGYEKEGVEGAIDFLNRNNIAKLILPKTWGNLTKDGRTAGWYVAYAMTPIAGALGLNAASRGVRIGLSAGTSALTWGMRVGAEQYRARDEESFWAEMEKQSLPKKVVVRLMKWAAETPNDHWLKSRLLGDNQHNRGVVEGMGAGAAIFGITEILEAVGAGDVMRNWMEKHFARQGENTAAARTSNVVMTPSESVRYEEGEFPRPNSQPDTGTSGGSSPLTGSGTVRDGRPVGRVPGGIPVRGEVPVPAELSNFSNIVKTVDQQPGQYLWDMLRDKSQDMNVTTHNAAAAGLLTRISKQLTTEPGKWVTLDDASTRKVLQAMDQAIQHMEAIRGGSSQTPLSPVEQLLVSGYLGGADVRVGQQLVEANPLFTAEQVSTILESVAK